MASKRMSGLKPLRRMMLAPRIKSGVTIPLSCAVWKSREISYVLKHSQAKAVVVESHLVPLLRESLDKSFIFIKIRIFFRAIQEDTLPVCAKR